MRTAVVLLAASALLATPALAQNEWKVEIGTAFGATLAIPDDGDSELFIGVPGAGTVLGFPSVYVTLLVSPTIMVEPQLHFQYNTIDEEALISPMLQLGYLLSPDAKSSPYVAVHGGGFFNTESGASNSGSLGVGFGHRIKLSTGAAFRMELLYRRWLSEDFKLNDVSLRLGLGAVL